MELCRRLGDSRCGKCGKRGAPFWCMTMMERKCWGGDCKCIGGTPACCKALLNRFFFARRNESAATRVASKVELLAFVRDMRSLPSAWWRNTLVLAQDMDISGILRLNHPIRVCGEATPDGRRTQLTTDATIVANAAFLDELTILCGNDHFHEGYPAVQTMFTHFTNSETFELGRIALHSCEVDALQGTAVMLASGCVSMDNCVLTAPSGYGIW